MEQLQMVFDSHRRASDTTTLRVSEDGIIGRYGTNGKLLRTATLKQVYGDYCAFQSPTGQWMLRPSA